MKRGILYIMIGLIMTALDPNTPEQITIQNVDTCGEQLIFSLKKHHYLDGNCNLVRDWINCSGPQDFIALHFPFDPLVF